MKRKDLRELDRQACPPAFVDKENDYEHVETKKRLKKERLQRRRTRREEEYSETET
jgi:hypothetical protein